MDVEASPLVEDERQAPARQLERSIRTASITRVGVNPRVAVVVFALLALLAVLKLLDLKGEENGKKEEATELQKKIEWPVSGQAPGTYAGYQGHLEFHGLCVGVNPGQVTWNFAMVQQRPCTEGANIQWVFKGHKLRLKAQMEKCLDVPNHKFQNGAMLQIYDCDLGGEDQRLVNPMVLGHTTGPPYRFQWANTESGVYFIDISNATAKLWNPVQIWEGPARSQLFNA